MQKAEKQQLLLRKEHLLQNNFGLHDHKKSFSKFGKLFFYIYNMDFLKKLKSVFQTKSNIEPDMKKFLIVGLGNIGEGARKAESWIVNWFG